MSKTVTRRAVITAATAAVALAPMSAHATASGSPAFAAKKREATAAWDRLHALYADQERRIEALRPRPEIPLELMQPLHLPGRDGPTPAYEDGWSASTLAGIVNDGTYLVGATSSTKFSVTTYLERKPVSADTRKRAAELLKVREAYDAEKEAWWARIRAIEDESTAPLAEVINLIQEVMFYPVTTTAEMRDKLAMIEATDFYNLTDDEAELRHALLEEALAIAENATGGTVS